MGWCLIHPARQLLHASRHCLNRAGLDEADVDATAQVLSRMAIDHQQGASKSGLAVGYLLGFVGVFVLAGQDGLAKIREADYEGLESFFLVICGGQAGKAQFEVADLF
jgi:hypothetical protein